MTVLKLTTVVNYGYIYCTCNEQKEKVLNNMLSTHTSHRAKSKIDEQMANQNIRQTDVDLEEKEKAFRRSRLLFVFKLKYKS